MTAPETLQQIVAEIMEAAQLLASFRIFTCSREKAKQPEGTDLFDQQIERLRKIGARLERLSASEATGGEAWIGCGECDSAFPCWNGEQRCLRLHPEQTDPRTDAFFATRATPPLPCDAGREADARDAARYRELATPEIHDFLKAVEREALHQRDRWGAEHDAGKTDADWFWLIGYLAGKAINKPEKLLHHVITTAAACLNWHAARVGAHTAMRPGIADPEAVRALAGGGT